MFVRTYAKGSSNEFARTRVDVSETVEDRTIEVFHHVVVLVLRLVLLCVVDVMLELVEGLGEVRAEENGWQFPFSFGEALVRFDDSGRQVLCRRNGKEFVLGEFVLNGFARHRVWDEREGVDFLVDDVSSGSLCEDFLADGIDVVIVEEFVVNEDAALRVCGEEEDGLR